jgi:serine/threonine protein kinase
MNAGHTLAHYEIIRPLGKGGTGEVYLAQDTKLKREVAVKVLPESVQSDPERLKRFRREAEAAKLNHPNIGTIHALEEFDDVLLIIMAYVEGETLSTHISSDGLANARPPAVIRAGQRDARFLYLH